MKLRLTAANPAGNVTLLVESPVPSVDYFFVAHRLLRAVSGAEQVGFLTAPQAGGDVRLEMMGGEFCGNAARCAGLYRIRQDGLYGTALVEISGCRELVPVTADETGVWADMPLPLSMERVTLDGVVFDAVRFEGIVHLVAECRPADDVWVRGVLPSVAERFGLPAAGMMFLDGETLVPAVYVRDTNSLFWENSCASGSAAVAWWDAVRSPDGSRGHCLRQPGGVIEARTEKKDGIITALRLGGSVTIEAASELELL